jgi:hypothetical protein
MHVKTPFRPAHRRRAERDLRSSRYSWRIRGESLAAQNGRSWSRGVRERSAGPSASLPACDAAASLRHCTGVSVRVGEQSSDSGHGASVQLGVCEVAPRGPDAGERPAAAPVGEGELPSWSAARALPKVVNRTSRADRDRISTAGSEGTAATTKSAGNRPIISVTADPKQSPGNPAEEKDEQ